jgi:hypothetical protein
MYASGDGLCKRTCDILLHVTPLEANVPKTTTADRVQKHRESLRAAGLRPVQIWIPDTRRRGFAKECRRQSLILRDDPNETEVLKWLSKSSSTKGWK